MASFSTAFMILAAAIALISVSAVEAQTTTTCVAKLATCFNALNTTTKPTELCCDSIKEAVEKELSCLCNVYNTPGLLAGFGVNTTQALGISRRCNVNTDLSACSTAGTPSPKGSLPPPPPGNTGKGQDAGAGNKLAGYGVTTVVLSLISAIFF